MSSLQEEIERSFGDGPEHRPVEDRLTSGRRAVRHRRAAAVVAGVAVVGVLGSTWASAPENHPRDGNDLVAVDPTPSLEPEIEDPQELPEGILADLGPDGLVLADGVSVVRRVDDPMGYEAPDKSLGLVLDDAGTRTWMLLMLEQEPGSSAGSSSTSDVAGRTFPTFDLWLADQVALQKGDPTLALVAFGNGETLVPEDGVEILDQRPTPEMPDEFAGPNDRTAVAMVRWQDERWFVLARETDPRSAGASGQPKYPPEYFPTAASLVGDPTTIDGFLEVAQERYAGGEGMR